MLCKECNFLYGEHINQPWFLELMNQQKKQDKLDTKELSIIMSPRVKSKGRPLTHWKIIEHVLQIYDDLESDESMSLRQIARAVNNAVSYRTIKNILMRYRKDVYCEKNKR